MRFIEDGFALMLRRYKAADSLDPDVKAVMAGAFLLGARHCLEMMKNPPRIQDKAVVGGIRKLTRECVIEMMEEECFDPSLDEAEGFERYVRAKYPRNTKIKVWHFEDFDDFPANQKVIKRWMKKHKREIVRQQIHRVWIGVDENKRVVRQYTVEHREAPVT
jgi:hypothetical protein